MIEDKMVGWITNLIDMNFNELQELAMNKGAWCAAVDRVAKSWT